MNHDIELSVYHENRELKHLIEEYRALLSRVSAHDDLPGSVKGMIQEQRNNIESKKRKK